MLMRKRGKVYWDWANPSLHVRSVDERQGDGSLINVQVRMSLLGRTQLFIGVYGVKGEMIYEESFDLLSAYTMTNALAWGLETARLKAPAGSVATGVKRRSPRRDRSFK